MAQPALGCPECLLARGRTESAVELTLFAFSRFPVHPLAPCQPSDVALWAIAHSFSKLLSPFTLNSIVSQRIHTRNVVLLLVTHMYESLVKCDFCAYKGIARLLF